MDKLNEIKTFIAHFDTDSEYQPEYVEYLRVLVKVAEAAKGIAYYGFDEFDVYVRGEENEWAVAQTAFYEALKLLDKDMSHD